MRAALRRFASAGYDATSVQVIAGDIGMSKQALMHHFPTKAALRDAVYEDVSNQFESAIPTLEQAIASDNPIDVVDSFADAFERDPVVTRFFVRELLDHPSETVAWLQARGGPVLSVIDAGGTPGGEIDPAAHAIAAAALLLTSATFLNDLDDTWRERVRLATRLLIKRGSTPTPS